LRILPVIVGHKQGVALVKLEHRVRQRATHAECPQRRSQSANDHAFGHRAGHDDSTDKHVLPGEHWHARGNVAERFLRDAVADEAVAGRSGIEDAANLSLGQVAVEDFHFIELADEAIVSNVLNEIPQLEGVVERLGVDRAGSD
jgi:hypothetical protein